MSDNKVETRITAEIGVMHFQEYLIKRKGIDNITKIEFAGSEKAKPAPGVVDSILASDGIIICPSNPLVSIGPILSLKHVREALTKSKAKKIAITPLIGGKPMKGPLDSMMRGLGYQVSAYSIACLYKDFLDAYILDDVDKDEASDIENLGIKVITSNTIMKTVEDKIRLAMIVIKEIQE
jgi:LPPG:FO 2-phospho-L-lactate transferase